MYDRSQLYLALIIASLLNIISLPRAYAWQDDLTVAAWIERSALSIDLAAAELPSLKQTLPYRVIGLGEATHGQHEFFDLKRRITMQLIRDQQVRLIAYEASVSRLMAARDYIAGKNVDRRQAVKSLGMLIWQIEENAELMDSLRDWNLHASPQDQVQLIGFDAQDATAVTNRLVEMLKADSAELAGQVTELASRAQTAVGELMGGNKDKWIEVAKEIESLKATLLMRKPTSVSKADYELCVSEFLAALTMYAAPGGRDRAMAELLIQQLDQAGPTAKCVVWAHNGHVQRTSLAYLGMEELAMGGHLAKQLGEQYYAIGFAFGQGEFQANVQTDGQWGFRRYRLSPAPAGSLEHTLGQAKHDAFLLDLRHAPKSTQVQEWLTTGHGQRWFGGYSVSDDCDERTRDASQLLATTPSRDFDCLLYVNKTTAAQPLDTTLIRK